MTARSLIFILLLTSTVGCRTKNENVALSPLQAIMEDGFPPTKVEFEQPVANGFAWREVDLKTGAKIFNHLLDSSDFRERITVDSAFEKRSPQLLPYRWRIRYTRNSGKELYVGIEDDVKFALVSSSDGGLIELRDISASKKAILDFASLQGPK